MWQRFSENARKAVFRSQEEGQRFGHAYVTPDHLLLGILQEPESAGSQMLVAAGMDPERIRIGIEGRQTPGNDRPSQDMSLTPSSKRVIDMAYDEARRRNDGYIGTEHLLLAIVRENQGAPLPGLDVDLDKLRDVAAEVVTPRPPSPREESALTPWSMFDSPGRLAIGRAMEEWVQSGRPKVAPEHLLLGLLRDPENRATKALAELGVDLDRLREHLRSNG